MAKGTRKGAGEPGGGEPASRREGSPEPGSPGRVGKGRGRGRPAGVHYSPEERRRLLEMYAKSGMTVDAFCRTVQISTKTLYEWRRRHAAEGPKGLEPRRLGRPKGSGAGSRLPDAVKAEVTETKRRFPFFGLRRIGAFLRRFRGIAVDPRSVGKVLREAELPVGEPARRRRRGRPRVRRFERARPGQLWQTDITSYVLARHHVRVYLIAFVDDHSRYVVSWALETRATKDAVAACLLDGVQKYGKPEEVLSDQGPQYYAWRGKSAFQKLLKKEGIRHAVARSHHPQTLGKCERLWKTVATELWDRTHPRELEEARQRLKQYFAFYNFFRPHQGIEDGIPAERFFGAAEAVKRQVEERVEKNALKLALGETPRRGLFVAGQVGERSFAMHGERGGVVFETDEGIREALGLEEMGMATGKEAGDDRKDGGGDGGDDGAGGGDRGVAAGGSADAAAAAAAGAPAGGGGAGAVGPGDGGGAAEGARGGDGDPLLVARGEPEGGGAGAPAGEAAAPLADVADGALGDGGGALEAAEEAGEGTAGDARGGDAGVAEEEGGAPRAGSAGGAGAGRAAADTSLVEGGSAAAVPGREEGCAGGGCPPRSGSGS